MKKGDLISFDNDWDLSDQKCFGNLCNTDCPYRFPDDDDCRNLTNCKVLKKGDHVVVVDFMKLKSEDVHQGRIKFFTDFKILHQGSLYSAIINEDSLDSQVTIVSKE